MAVTKNWEQGLKVYLPDTNTLTDRNAVAGPSSEGWVAENSLRLIKNADPNTDYNKVFDFWWSAWQTLTVTDNGLVPPPRYHVVGFNADWGKVFTNAASKWNLFTTAEPQKNFEPLVYPPYRNEMTNVWTFDHGADEIAGMVKWFDHWQPIVQGWADSVDSTVSDWKGSAAGALRRYLLTFVTEMAKVRLDLTAPTEYSKAVLEKHDLLHKQIHVLYQGWQTWQGERTSHPIDLLHDAFLEAMNGARLTFGPTPEYTYDYWNKRWNYEHPDVITVVDGTGADVVGGDWIKKVEAEAKKKWLAGIATLDKASNASVGPLDDAYSTLARALGKGVYSPNLTLSPGGGGGTGPGGTGNTGLDDIFKDKDGEGEGEGGGGTEKPDIPKPDIPTTGDKPGGTGDKPVIPPVPSPGTPGTKPPGTPGTKPPTVPKPDIPVPGQPGGNGNGNKVPLLDKNGKPVLDKNKQPIMVPPGSRIGKDGKVYGPDGKPVLGPDKKQIVAPPGAKVGTPNQSQNNNNNNNTNLPGQNTFDQIRLPEGAKILPNGTVVGADGKQLYDANGNPYTLPKGSTIKDGVIYGPDGKPLSRSHQLLTNADNAYNNRTTPRPNTTSQGGGDHNYRTNVPNHSRSPELPGGNGVPKVKPGTPNTVGGLNTLGDRATKFGATAPTTAASTAAAAAAQQARTAAQTSAQAPGQQSPMMPPMGGAGAGAGGAPNQGKDRQRTTWLTEDEDTWGTDTGTVSGVIGR
ncbi:hypothetical protein [Streptomyces sp. NPDC090025]|uniref:hypothetical protein n=1 Tax=Streptomyces sp. NPDC090025 TaxID=3365922 RepID=UPI003833F966